MRLVLPPPPRPALAVRPMAHGAHGLQQQLALIHAAVLERKRSAGIAHPMPRPALALAQQPKRPFVTPNCANTAITLQIRNTQSVTPDTVRRCPAAFTFADQCPRTITPRARRPPSLFIRATNARKAGAISMAPTAAIEFIR